MSVTTEITRENAIDTTRAPFSSYRLLHYMADVIANMLSNPINIQEDKLAALFTSNTSVLMGYGKNVTVAPVYGKSTIESGTFPCIRVSGGAITAIEQLNPLALPPVTTKAGWRTRGKIIRPFTASVEIAMLGTNFLELLLIGDFLFSFFACNDVNIARDCGFIDLLRVQQMSAPAQVNAEELGGGATLFQRTLSLIVTSNICTIADVQGPVFRGVTPKAVDLQL